MDTLDIQQLVQTVQHVAMAGMAVAAVLAFAVTVLYVWLGNRGQAERW